MKKHPIRILAVLIALLLTATACSTVTPPAPSPSPSMKPIVSVAPSVMPSVEPSPSALTSPMASAAAGMTARKVGSNIAIYVGETKVEGEAYYDARNVMVFPLSALAKATGWEVKNTDTGMTLTKSSDTVTIMFTKPTGTAEEATAVTAKKGTATLTVDTTLLFIGEELYVPEAFIDSALQPVDISFNNTDRITITPAKAA